MMLIVPIKRPPIYCTVLIWEVSPLRKVMVAFFRNGLGPSGLAKEEKPFPLVTKICWPIVLTQVGYQPVGIKPLDLLSPGLLTSNTARQLLSALATYSVFSSGLNATA